MTSSFYCRFPQEIEDRLDENFSKPSYDRIEALLSRSKFPTVTFEEDQQYLTAITSGRTPKSIKYLKDGIPFLGATGIDYGRVNLEMAPKIAVELHQGELRNSRIQKGDVLVTMAGAIIGRCAVFNLDEECNANQAVGILRVNQDLLNPDYLVLYLNSPLGQLFFGKYKHMSSQPNINLDELKMIKIIVPDMGQQKHIVEKCGVDGDMAAGYEARIKKIKDYLDVPFRRVVKMNPKGYERLYASNYYALAAEDLDSEWQRLDFVANHPVFDWVRRFRASCAKSLGNLIDPKRFSYGLSVSASELGEFGFLNVQHLNLQGGIVFDPPTYIDTCPPDKRLRKNDVIIARTGATLGKAALITEEYDGFAFGSFCIRFSLDTEEYTPSLVAQYINSIYGQAQLTMLKAGSGKSNINQEHIEDVRIPTLDKETQKLILASYDSSLKKVSDLEAELRGLDEESNKKFEGEIIGVN